VTSYCGHVCFLFDVFLEQMSLSKEKLIMKVGKSPSMCELATFSQLPFISTIEHWH